MGAHYNSRDPARSRNQKRRAAAASEYDTLLPVQYYESVASGRTPSGELKLFFAILEDALRCYVRSKNCRSGPRRAEFVDARTWFHERGMPHVFAFESVCAFLSIDANWLRKRIETMGPQDLPVKQFRTQRRLPSRPTAHRSQDDTRPSRSARLAAETPAPEAPATSAGEAARFDGEVEPAAAASNKDSASSDVVS
jgi:hypothetical protein